jgi:hypothetical protein
VYLEEAVTVEEAEEEARIIEEREEGENPPYFNL